MKRKYLIISSLGIVTIAVLLLATGLDQIQFRPGNLFSEDTLFELKNLLAQFGPYKGLVWICLAVIPLLFLIFSGTKRRKSYTVTKPHNWLLRVLVYVLIWALALTVLRRQVMEGNIDWTPPQLDMDAIELPISEPIQIIPLQIPEWASFLSSLILIILVGLGIWFAYRRWQRSVQPLDLLVQEATVALEELDAGVDFRNVILRCYHEMVRIVERSRAVKRDQGMTAREFEARLVALGLPEKPIVQLTRLFEAVRYGSKDLGLEAEEQARGCLSAIVRASGEPL